jgi:hypothetical protein
LEATLVHVAHVAEFLSLSSIGWRSGRGRGGEFVQADEAVRAASRNDHDDQVVITASR